MTEVGPQRHDQHGGHQQNAKDNAKVGYTEDLLGEVRRGRQHRTRPECLEDKSAEQESEGSRLPRRAELLHDGMRAGRRGGDVAVQSAHARPAAEHSDGDERTDDETHDQVAGVGLRECAHDDGCTDAEDQDGHDLDADTPRHERRALRG